MSLNECFTQLTSKKLNIDLTDIFLIACQTSFEDINIIYDLYIKHKGDLLSVFLEVMDIQENFGKSIKKAKKIS